MSRVVKCQCGWEGAVDDAVADQPVRCLACGSLLPHSVSANPVAADDSAAPAGSSPTAESADAAARRAGNPQVAAAMGTVKRIARQVWDYLRAALRFYWENRSGLRDGWMQWMSEVFPSVEHPEVLRREIRVPLEEQPGIHDAAGVWEIELPPRCAVCAGKVRPGWIEESHHVLDLYNPLIAFVAGVAAGLVFGWWYHSLAWLILAPLAGLLLGYALRKSVEFLVRFQRCDRHADETRIPEVEVFHRHLVLRVGTREVKLAFLRQGQDASPIGEMLPPHPQDASRGIETISLADSVAPDAAIVPDRTEGRLAGADDESGHPPAGPDDYRVSR
jgi:hypothetical protein